MESVYSRHRQERMRVEEVLRETLRETTLVRKPNTRFDVVGLRLHSYMLENDPILSENDGAALHELEEMSHTLDANRIANACIRLDEVLISVEGEAHGDLDRAIAAVNVEAEIAEGQGERREEEENDVLIFCRDRGWLANEQDQWLCLAMIRRGLSKHPTEACVWCCKRQIWDFEQCMNHYTNMGRISCLPAIATNCSRCCRNSAGFFS